MDQYQFFAYRKQFLYQLSGCIFEVTFNLAILWRNIKLLWTKYVLPLFRVEVWVPCMNGALAIGILCLLGWLVVPEMSLIMSMLPDMGMVMGASFVTIRMTMWLWVSILGLVCKFISWL